MKKTSFSFTDLFCGAGGLSLGFQRAGFVCLRAIDNDRAATSTYSINFKDHISCEKISENTSIPDSDLIIGGPPCQGFSSAGARNPEDKRNSLVSIFSSLVTQYKPKAFVFENVEGFLTSDSGKRILDLLEPLVEAGYQIHIRKINAANYGVPQHRKRVIAIGGLGWPPSFPEPTNIAYGAPGASKTRMLKLLPFVKNLSKALEGLPLPSKEPPGIPDGHFIKQLSELDIKRISLLKPGQTMRDLPKEFWHESYHRRANRRVMDGTPTECRGGPPAGLKRLKGEEPCKAITSGAISEFVHPNENRFLTLRECARIQTFPDNFSFSGTFAQISLQIGNAVPPLLAEKIAESVYHDLLFKVKKTSKGSILSFLPTNSYGMSPALEKVCKLMNDKFGVEPLNKEEQSQLWR
jgi:DNA (cytosine-5)-methyltransferase 1